LFDNKITTKDRKIEVEISEKHISINVTTLTDDNQNTKSNRNSTHNKKLPITRSDNFLW
jgi:hypothetical protein